MPLSDTKPTKLPPKPTWVRILIFLLLVNFVNLSANFYEGPLDQQLVDPMDTVSELVYEFLLDGDGEAIPDMDSEQEDSSFEKIKLFVETAFSINVFEIDFLKIYGPSASLNWSRISINLTSPPPDHS